jgi:predicted transcriptional regulator of viral defense system
MKYIEFKKIMQAFPFFSSSQFANITDNEQVLKNQLNLWQKQGLVLRLKRGLYILNEEDRRINPSRLFIASQLFCPSYISTEYALSFYGLIPEKVEDVTSVTTKKTLVLRNSLGIFRYQHIKTACFIGFKQNEDENNLPFFIAEPEKAVVDFLYLNLSNFKESDKDIFELSYRFQNTQDLSKKKLKDFSHLFNSKKLIKVVNSFCDFIKSGE